MGNTPAYAGKTQGLRLRKARHEKHPRVCGEDRRQWRSCARGRETPPRMRGRLLSRVMTALAEGNTPAYAGKTGVALDGARLVRKHPRVCGEDTQYLTTRQLHLETPPRMRGRPFYAGVFGTPNGNTPAYAGKTSAMSRSRSGTGKHPRVCGEDHEIIRKYMKKRETPPRMRGRHLTTTGEHVDGRNTPAYAGKTFLSAICSPVCWKHPRVCGEDFSIAS